MEQVAEGLGPVAPVDQVGQAAGEAPYHSHRIQGKATVDEDQQLQAQADA